MLLNISNHPSPAWPENQTKEAIALYGSISDLPFPLVNPNDDEEAIQQLAENYLNQIMSLKPTAVHLMGELTFTHALVLLLKQQGILVIASTTLRAIKIMDNGSKVSHFDFVRFRAY